MRKTYVIKRTLNAWIEHHTFNRCFYHTIYMRFEKHAFNAWYEKHAFYHPLRSLMLAYYNPCIKIVFSRNVRLMHVLVNVYFTKCVFYVRYFTYVKCALMNVRETRVTRFTCLPCVKRMFNMRFKKHMVNACFTFSCVNVNKKLSILNHLFLRCSTSFSITLSFLSYSSLRCCRSLTSWLRFLELVFSVSSSLTIKN